MRKQCKYYDVCGNTVGGNSRHLECSKCSTIRKRYGITLEERNIIFEDQGGTCAICEVPVKFYNTMEENPQHYERAVVDHCHTSNHVRGILCHSCNVALGLVKDDESILIKMISYLK